MSRDTVGVTCTASHVSTMLLSECGGAVECLLLSPPAARQSRAALACLAVTPRPYLLYLVSPVLRSPPSPHVRPQLLRGAEPAAQEDLRHVLALGPGQGAAWLVRRLQCNAIPLLCLPTLICPRPLRHYTNPYTYVSIQPCPCTRF